MLHRRKKNKLRRIKQAAKSATVGNHSPDSSMHPSAEEVNEMDDASPCVNENCKNYIQSLELECQALRTENKLLKEKK